MVREYTNEGKTEEAFNVILQGFKLLAFLCRADTSDLRILLEYLKVKWSLGGKK